MKSTTSIRLLSLIAFLLLIAPFYDSCNRKGMKRSAESTDAVVDSINAEIQDSIQEINPNQIIEEKNIFTKIFNYIDDDNSENVFEFASMNSNYFEQTFDEFIQSIKNGIKENDYEGFFFGLKNISFLFIIIITFLVFAISFTNKNSYLSKLTKLNLLLLLVTVICIFLEGLFEDIRQIKWGYYLFIIVQIILFNKTRQRLKVKFEN